MKNKDISNQEKYNTYRNLMKRMDIAKDYGFYFEMCMIAYALIEDRSSAALRHADEKERNSLYYKIIALKKLLDSEDNLFKKAYNVDNFNKINLWRKERNSLVHSMANMKFDSSKLKEIAEEGYKLSKELSNMVTRYKRLKK